MIIAILFHIVSSTEDYVFKKERAISDDPVFNHTNFLSQKRGSVFQNIDREDGFRWPILC